MIFRSGSKMPTPGPSTSVSYPCIDWKEKPAGVTSCLPPSCKAGTVVGVSVVVGTGVALGSGVEVGTGVSVAVGKGVEEAYRRGRLRSLCIAGSEGQSKQEYDYEGC